jgi:hypothetical protein
MGGQFKDQQEILAMTGEDVEKSVIEHVINVSERLSEMRDIVGENLESIGGSVSVVFGFRIQFEPSFSFY